MKFDDLINKILGDMGLKEATYGQIIEWSIKNNTSTLVSNFTSAIGEDKILQNPKKDLAGRTFLVDGLEHSGFFIPLANSYTNAKCFDEAIQLFEAMTNRGSNESAMFNDYGRALINKMLDKKTYKKEDLDLARKLIFKAFDYDKKVVANCYEYPAYKNLCYLRAIEASTYHAQGDLFAAFLLGWMSIEMTITRIWYQFLTLKSTDGEPLVDSNLRLIIGVLHRRPLMDSDIYTILEILYSCDIDERFKIARTDIEKLRHAKNDLSTLRGIRNKLLHGEIDNPSSGDSERCIKTALELIPLFQSV